MVSQKIPLVWSQRNLSQAEEQVPNWLASLQAHSGRTMGGAPGASNGEQRLCVSLSRLQVILRLWGHDGKTCELRASSTYSKGPVCVRSQKREKGEQGSCLLGINSLMTR